MISAAPAGWAAMYCVASVSALLKAATVALFALSHVVVATYPPVGTALPRIDSKEGSTTRMDLAACPIGRNGPWGTEEFTSPVVRAVTRSGTGSGTMGTLLADTCNCASFRSRAIASGDDEPIMPTFSP